MEQRKILHSLTINTFLTHIQNEGTSTYEYSNLVGGRSLTKSKITLPTLEGWSNRKQYCPGGINWNYYMVLFTDVMFIVTVKHIDKYEHLTGIDDVYYINPHANDLIVTGVKFACLEEGKYY